MPFKVTPLYRLTLNTRGANRGFTPENPLFTLTVDADTAKKYYKRLGIKFFPHPLSTFDDGGVYNLIQNEETVTSGSSLFFIARVQLLQLIEVVISNIIFINADKVLK